MAKETYHLDTTDELCLIYEDKNTYIEVLGGLDMKQPHNQLNLSVRIVNKEEQKRSFRDYLNWYVSKEVDSLKDNAVERLYFDKEQLETSLELFISLLENHRSEKRKEALQKATAQINDKVGVLNQKQLDGGLKYLNSPILIQNIQRDLKNIGVIAEGNNSFLLYLVYTSRLLKQPLHCLLFGASGSGKSYLQQTISETINKDSYIELTAMSAKSLYHFSPTQLKNRLLLIQDLHDMKDSLYSLRELMSKGKLTKILPQRNGKYGAYETVYKEVTGPVSVVACTTESEVYFDNQNRAVEIHLKSSKEHTEAVMQRQRKVASGEIDTDKEQKLKNDLQVVQKLLQPYRIKNPYAEHLKLPETVSTPLRLNEQYLKIIETICLINQYQREKEKTKSGEEVLIVAKEDIEVANELMKDLIKTKSDILNPGERRFIQKLKEFFKGKTFNKSEVCKHTKIALSSTKRYLKSLVEKGFLKVESADRYAGFQYVLVQDMEYEQLQNIIDNVLGGTLTTIEQVA